MRGFTAIGDNMDKENICVLFTAFCRLRMLRLPDPSYSCLVYAPIVLKVLMTKGDA